MITISLAGISVVGAQDSLVDAVFDTKLVGDGTAIGDNFGNAVAVDGDTMVIAAPGTDVDAISDSGLVHVYRHDQVSGEWLVHQLLRPDDGDFDSTQMSVAIDGDTIVVGAYYANGWEGAVYVFERDLSDDRWSQIKRLTDPSVGFHGQFGIGVAIDNGLLAVGAPMTQPMDGKVTIFERDRGGPNNWGEVTTLLDSIVGDGGDGENFGMAVAFDGDLLLVGASAADVSFLGEHDGAAYLFRRSEVDRDRWDYLMRLIAPGSDDCMGGLTVAQFLADPASDHAEADRCRLEDSKSEGDRFGSTVAIDGDTVVIGAPNAEGGDGSWWVGAVHVFEADPDNLDAWQHVALLVPGDALEQARFGGALALAGDTFLSGASGAAFGSGNSYGAAYVYVYEAGWTETEKLVAPESIDFTRFGATVAFDGETKVFGAEGDDERRGAVYVQATPDTVGEFPFEPTGTLADGGIVEGTEGEMLAAIEGALGAPIGISIRAVDDTEEPLDDGAEPIGGYIQIAAESDILTPFDAPLVVGMTIPEEVDPFALSAWKLISADRITDGPDSGFLWMPTMGNYDPESNLFLVGIHALGREPTTFILLRSDENPQAPSRRRQSARTTWDGFEFDVSCGFHRPFDGCTEDVKDLTAQELIKAYDEFSNGSTKTPAIFPKLYFWVLGGDAFARTVNETSITLIPEDDEKKKCGPINGLYVSSDHKINLCINRVTGSLEPDPAVPEQIQLNSSLVQTIRHELFHAIQDHSLPGNFANQDKAETEWAVEGTATAVEIQGAEISRSPEYSLRMIDVPLTFIDELNEDELHEYETQDFWVFISRDLGLKSSDLIKLFDEGADTSFVNAFLELKSNTFLGLAYWEWVKNQVIEKTFDFDGELSNPCKIETALFSENEPLKYPSGGDSTSSNGSLKRLTSKVVKIEFGVGATAPITVKVNSAENLQYKIYVDDEANCDSGVENDPRTFEAIPQQPVYVLLSYIDHLPGQTVTYTVSVDN